ncbi:hypothetical protein [Massilia aquatica]|uniref:Uncharacterized protein n=1 Tax=Massilia aquatica TaxID=2609000 RepID=A0ABX0MH93_9BURK|nr:hypothetical protein [Massilia aquatica]NHZ44268.1 hypothetical protein [Massilia aquatica]
MSKIVVVVRSFGADKKAVIQAVRRTIDTSIADIIQAVAGGTPVIEKKFADRDDPGSETKLIGLVELLLRENVDFSIYELLDHQTFAPTATYFQPSLNALRCIAEGRIASLEFQRSLDILQEEKP